MQHFLQLAFISRARHEEFEAVAAHDAGTQHDDLLLVLGHPAQILPGHGQRVADGLCHVHAQRQMNAALEVEAEINLFVGEHGLQGRSQPRHARKRIREAEYAYQQGDAETPTQRNHEHLPQKRICPHAAGPNGARKARTMKGLPLLQAGEAPIITSFLRQQRPWDRSRRRWRHG